MAKKIITKKKCPKCRRTLPLSSFYSNREYVDESGHDLWCKECAEKHIKKMDDLKSYCEANHRVFSLALFNAVLSDVDNALMDDEKYNGIDKPDMAHTYRLMKVKKAFFGRMNRTQYYQYQDGTKEFAKDEIAKIDKLLNVKSPSTAFVNGEIESDKKVYDMEWNGLFSKNDLEYLKNFYEEMSGIIDINDVDIRDTVRLLAKIALVRDKAYQELYAGAGGKDALAYFEKMSQLYIKTNDKLKESVKNKVDTANTRFNSFGQIVELLENEGKLMDKPKDMERDQIDDLISTLTWFQKSIDPSVLSGEENNE